MSEPSSFDKHAPRCNDCRIGGCTTPDLCQEERDDYARKYGFVQSPKGAPEPLHGKDAYQQSDGAVTSETPRTDAAILRTVNIYIPQEDGSKRMVFKLVEAAVSRQLERELAEANTLLRECREVIAAGNKLLAARPSATRQTVAFLGRRLGVKGSIDHETLAWTQQELVDKGYNIFEIVALLWGGAPRTDRSAARTPINLTVLDIAQSIVEGDDNPTAGRIVARALLDMARSDEGTKA